MGLLTGVEGGGMVSLDEVPADDWLSSVSPPMSMSGVAASCSCTSSTSSSSLPSAPPASGTLDAVLQQRINTKNYLRFFMNCYIMEIVCMNVCMSILREKLFTTFYDFLQFFYELLHYGNSMHECMYVNSKRKIIYNFL